MTQPLDYGRYYHVYNRGNNRENIFVEARNYYHFLGLYAKQIVPVADTYSNDPLAGWKSPPTLTFAAWSSTSIKTRRNMASSTTFASGPIPPITPCFRSRKPTCTATTCWPGFKAKPVFMPPMNKKFFINRFCHSFPKSSCKPDRFGKPVRFTRTRNPQLLIRNRSTV